MDGATSLQSRDAVTCTACGALNSRDALFCSRCTAPLAIAAIQELHETDLRLCRTALFEVLAEAGQLVPRHETAPQHDESLWRAYLNVFWLRPETALILYAEALAIRSLSDRIGHPWMDLGCGDGIHAALVSGWRFGPSFDAFQSLDLDAKDIYHHWDATRFYADVEQQGQIIGYGIDIKPTATARAKALGVFEKVHCGDAGRLPVADSSVRTIFSNMLRDLGQPLGAALRECRRVLRDDGVLLLSAMTPEYPDSLYFLSAARKAQDLGEVELAKRLLKLDRGRSMFCQRQLSFPQWQTLLQEYKLRVVDVVPIVSPMVIRFWDVGLRPFSPSLLRQRQAWSDSGVLHVIKPAIVDLIASQLQQLVVNLNAGPVHCMNLLVVRKS
jgi:SAM-dependent methyltransferase